MGRQMGNSPALCDLVEARKQSSFVFASLANGNDWDAFESCSNSNHKNLRAWTSLGGENVFRSSPSVSIPVTFTGPSTKRFWLSDKAYESLDFATKEAGIHPLFTKTLYSCTVPLPMTNGVTT